MSAHLPTLFTWDGEAMRPTHPRLAASRFEPGETYVLAPTRSKKSHDHYFAVVAEAWANLPEHLAERFPTDDALRKHALIRCGFRDERSIVCSSRAEALRVAAFVRPLDEYAVVVASEAVVTIYTAKSQSMKAMGKEMFQASKEQTLAWMADLLGVDPAALNRQRDAA